MIHVERSSADPDIPVYTKKTSTALDGVSKVTRAERELERAIRFFTDPANFKDETKLNKKKFKFSVFKDDALAAELTAAFHGKCAYCESKFAAVTPADIEHYRPKNAIETGSKTLKPGYYWLAGSWTNLLLSCVDCNRARGQDVPGEDDKETLGKAAQFPLADEDLRVRHHTDDVVGEEPARLLLQPCLDEQPDEHLAFADDGLVRAVEKGGDPSPKAVASIEVYALQRKGLVEARKEEALELLFQFETVADAAGLLLEALASGDADRIAKRERRLNREFERLTRRMSATAPYLALKRQLIVRAKGAGELDDLLALGIDPEDLLTLA